MSRACAGENDVETAGERRAISPTVGRRARGDAPFEHSLRLSARMPAARLLRTWGLGHRRVLRDRDVIRAAVDFVSGRDDALPAKLPLLPLPAPLY